jgi:hypothetical protein
MTAMSDNINRQTGLSEHEHPPLAERILFENRVAVIMVFVLMTLLLGWQALQIEPDASFEKMIPTSHPYIQNYLDNKADLASLSNSVRIIVATSEGDIFDKEFQEALRQINDEVFYIPGVDRSRLQSIWTPKVFAAVRLFRMVTTDRTSHWNSCDSIFCAPGRLVGWLPITSSHRSSSLLSPTLTRKPVKNSTTVTSRGVLKPSFATSTRPTR